MYTTCVSCAHRGHIRREQQIPWNQSYRWSQTTMWVLETEPGFPTRATCDLNCSSISSAPSCC